MRFIHFMLLLLIIISIPGILRAQVIYGNIREDESRFPIGDVLITNLNTGIFSLSDSKGDYRIAARSGEKLKYEKQGYTTVNYLITASGYQEFRKDLELNKNYYVLEEVTIYSDLNTRQKDSLEEKEIYKLKLNRQAAKMKVRGTGGGMVVESPISTFIEKWSPKYKKQRAFKARFHENAKRDWVDEQYPLEEIADITGLKGDSLIAFRNQHPVPYDLAQYASELEVKHWILEQLKKWMENPYVPILDDDVWEPSRKTKKDR